MSRTGSASTSCPFALVWLTLRGASGEVDLIVEGVGTPTHVPLYLTGPPFHLRASLDTEAGCVSGAEAGPLLVRLVDARGKQVCGLPFQPTLSLHREPPSTAAAHSPSGVPSLIW